MRLKIGQGPLIPRAMFSREGDSSVHVVQVKTLKITCALLSWYVWAMMHRRHLQCLSLVDGETVAHGGLIHLVHDSLLVLERKYSQLILQYTTHFRLVLTTLVSVHLLLRNQIPSQLSLYEQVGPRPTTTAQQIWLTICSRMLHHFQLSTLYLLL